MGSTHDVMDVINKMARKMWLSVRHYVHEAASISLLVAFRAGAGYFINYACRQRVNEGRSQGNLSMICIVLPTQRAPTFYANESSSFSIMLKGQPIRALITSTLVAVPYKWVVQSLSS